MATRREFENDLDFIGAELVDRVQSTEGISPVNVANVGFGKQNKNPYQTSHKCVFIDIDNYQAFSEFYSGLPFSIRRLVTISLFEDDIVELRQHAKQYDTSKVEFVPTVTPQLKEYIDTVISYIQHIYNTPIVKEKPFMPECLPITQEGKNTIKITESVLDKADGTQSHVSVRQLLTDANLGISEMEYISNTDDPYEYEVELCPWYYDGISDDLPTLDPSKFITRFLYTQTLYCENCNSDSVIQVWASGSVPYVCTNCNTEYEHTGVGSYNHEGKDVQTAFEQNPPSEFVELVSTQIEIVEQEVVSERVAEFVGELESKTLLADQLPNRAVVFEFIDDTILAHILSGCIHLQVRMSKMEYTTRQISRFYAYRCASCGENTAENYQFKNKKERLDLWLPSSITAGMGVGVSPLCSECLEEFGDGLEQLLKDTADSTELLTYIV